MFINTIPPVNCQREMPCRATITVTSQMIFKTAATSGRVGQGKVVTQRERLHPKLLPQPLNKEFINHTTQ